MARRLARDRRLRPPAPAAAGGLAPLALWLLSIGALLALKRPLSPRLLAWALAGDPTALTLLTLLAMLAMLAMLPMMVAQPAVADWCSASS